MTTSKPTIALAMIVRNVERFVGRCLESAAPYFDEFVVVDTGSTDATKSRVLEVVPSAKILDFNPETHPASFIRDSKETWQESVPEPFTGKLMLADFGAARQHGWKEVTSDYAMWIDSDDLLVGGDKIQEVLADMRKDGVDTAMLSYDYEHDGAGKVTCKLTRERILRRGVGTWVQPIHEVVGPTGASRFYEQVKVKHQRAEYGIKPEIASRNMKVLLHYFKDKDWDTVDARMLFYLGMETKFTWPEKSIAAYQKYCTRSGWDEERSVAHMSVGLMFENQQKYDLALAEYAQAVVESDFRPEGYFGTARIAYYKRDYGKCAEWTEKGIAVRKESEKRQSVLMYDPLERYYRPHVYYSASLIELGRHKEALDVCVEGLKWNPEDPFLKGNKIVAENALKPKEEVSSGELSVTFSRNEDLNAPSISLPKDVMTSFAIQFWKRHVEARQYDEALAFLDRLPTSSVNSSKVDEARAITRAKMSTSTSTSTSKSTPPSSAVVRFLGPTDGKRLRIVIWTGLAWEVWTPRSIDNGGIGGSETAAVCMARELVKQGHEVVVISDCPREEIFEGVRYVPFREATPRPSEFACDVMVVSRQAEAVLADWPAKTTFLWVHDVNVGAPSSRLAASLVRYDKVLCLSEWHKGYFRECYPTVHRSNVVVTRNGIDVQRFKGEPVKRGNKIIYSSSPDRGLEDLLAMLHAIKAEVPDVELNVYYGFTTWLSMAQSSGDAAFKQRALDIEALLKSRVAEGLVRYHGRVGQKVLAGAFLESKVWAYPTMFTETHCQLAGALVFTDQGMRPIESLKEGDHVLTHKGRFMPVVGTVKKKYAGDLYSIKRKKDFNPITVTDEHPVYTASFHKRNDSKGGRVGPRRNVRTMWRIPSDIRPKLDFLVTPKMKFGNLNKIKISDYVDNMKITKDGKIGTNPNHPLWKTINDEVRLTSDFMFILGLFAADGCAVESSKRRSKKTWMSQIVFAQHLTDEKTAKKIINFFGDGSTKPTSENGMSTVVCNSPWSHFLLNAVGKRRNKRVPPFVWRCSRRLQNAFLKGLLHGDGSTVVSDRGHAEKSYVYENYTTISPSLAYGASQLLTNQGLFPSINFNEERKAYELLWSKGPQKPAHWKVESVGIATRVQKIEKSKYAGWVYNIDVAEDRSYVTDRTIVHNCITAIEAQAAGCVPVTTSLAALAETVKHGVLLPPPNSSPEYVSAFVGNVVRLLKDDGARKKVADEARAYAMSRCGWDGVAKEWVTMFEQELSRKSDNPLPLAGDI